MKLSIITVCYNNLQGLIKTVESVKAQTFTDFEFIVIDGGSSDGSADYLKENSDLFSYWVSEKDGGIYNAMNKGIEVAKGEYCLFLNSGDYLANDDVFETLFDGNDSFGIIYGDVVKRKGKRKRKLKYKDVLSACDFFTIAPAIHHQAALIKRALFESFGSYREDTYLISDWILFFEAFCKGVSMKHVDRVVSVCDMSGASNKYDMNNPKIQYDEAVRKQIIGGYCTNNKIEYKVLDDSIIKKLITKIKWRLSALVPLSFYTK